MLRPAILTATALAAGFGIRALAAPLQESLPATQEAPQESAEELPPLWYAVLLRPGPKWKKDLPPSEQPGIDDHLDHLVQQFQTGHLVLGGPFLDDSGGLAVLRAASLAEAKKIATSDPAVEGGLLKVAGVHPWLVPLCSLVEPEDDEGGPDEGHGEDPDSDDGIR